jgi:hypothetical protein
MKKNIITLFTLFVVVNAAQAESSTAKAQSEVLAVKNSYSMQAFTGVFNTPTAETIGYGTFAFSYSNNYFDQGTSGLKKNGFQKAHDLKFGVGILPNVEVIGRLGTKTWVSNCYTEGCGTRDLSGSLKWQIPFIPKDWFSLAIGGQDIAGSVVKSKAYYVSGSKEFSFSSIGAVRTSLGVAKSDNAIGYMDGVIGSVEYQPFDVLQLAAEYDANAVNAGVKVFAPETWLPNGWDLYLSAQLYSSDKEHNEQDSWFNAGVNIPLGLGSYFNKENKIRTARNEELATKLVSADVEARPSAKGELLVAGDSNLRENNAVLLSEATPESNYSPLAHHLPEAESLKEFSAYLTDYGFESVSVGIKSQNQGKIIVVRFENNLYNRDEQQAMDIVAALVRSHLDVDAVVEMTNYGLIVAKIDVFSSAVYGKNNAGSESERLNTYADDSPKSVKKSFLAGLLSDDVDWVVKNESSAHFVPRLIFSPAVSSLIGTEYGAFDYQLVLSSNLQMSVWDGGVIDLRHLSTPLLNSDDFEQGEYFDRQYGIKDGIDNRLFHQTFSLPYNVFSKFSYGRINGNSDGLLNETRWASDNNLHRVSLLLGDYEDSDLDQLGRKVFHQPKLLKYRYRYRPLDWDVELTAGEYWEGDKGFTLRSLHWFGDVQVGLKYQRTKFDEVDGGEEEDFLALGFSIPLNLKKSMRSNYGFQVRGVEQWNYYVETSLTEKNTGNQIKTGFGKEPFLYHNLNQAYFNRDRGVR